MTFKAESKFLNVQKIFKKNQKELLGSTIKLSNTTISKSRNKFLKQLDSRPTFQRWSNPLYTTRE